jgi:hypothetical protein
MDDLTLMGMTKLQARQLMDLMTNHNNAKSPRNSSPRGSSPFAPQSPLLQQTEGSRGRNGGVALSPRSGGGGAASSLRDRAAKIKDVERQRAERKRLAAMPPPPELAAGPDSPTSPTKRELRRLRNAEKKAEKATMKVEARNAWQAVLKLRHDQSRPGELFEGRLLLKIAPGKYFGSKWEQRYVVFDRRSRYMDVFVEDSATKESTTKVGSAEGPTKKGGLGRKNQVLVTSASVVNKQVKVFSAASEREQMDWLAELSPGGSGQETKEERGLDPDR